MDLHVYLPHLQEDVADLFAHFEERVQSAAIRRKTLSLEVVLLVRGCLPRVTAIVMIYRHTLRMMGAYLVSISIVRSVSGFDIDVLKADPFLTVNHWPFLLFRSRRSQRGI